MPIDRSSLVRFCLGLLCLLTTGLVQAQQLGNETPIVITDGRDAAIPIAIVPFAWEAAAAPDTTFIDVVVRADLNRSGQFNALARERVIEVPRAATRSASRPSRC